ncbi:hypothetical protein BDN70DRAFT_994780 [Pholiota conissans]|uniref:DUF6533 domain-containing protein n=1 Tax=Pholiota conissans TaxID=109636 RepID=A0A9P6CYV1_9AGAR|nr:hypothetical protein BDN70DRAFT_994780 [Pholiota conissans]
MSIPHELFAPDPAYIAYATENLVFRKWSAVATQVLLVYEYTITFRSEIRYIWGSPVSFVKAIYLFSRYYGLVVQAVNLYLVSGPLAKLDIPEHVCRRWFYFLISSGCTLAAALDAILMLRVYALYLQDDRVGLFLAALFSAQRVVEGILAPIVLDVPLDSICDLRKTHKASIYFGISIMIKHTILLVMTLAKRKLAALGAPVVRLVRRDGIWVVVLLFAIFATIIPYSFVKQVAKAHVVFGWPMSLISILCCRMIMNMQQLNVNTSDENEESELTTCTSSKLDEFALYTLDSDI